MAVTITPEITGQVANATFSYCYIFEPLRIYVSESTSTATKIFVDLEIIDIGSNTIINSFSRYAEFDLSQSLNISFDLMEIAKQHRDSNVYKNANVDDFSSTIGRWSVVSRYKYNFKIYSDVNALEVLIKKIPIIGVREFSQFTPAVDETIPINEFEYYGLDPLVYEQRWRNIWLPRVTLVPPTTVNANPIITKIIGGGTVNVDTIFIQANTDEAGSLGVTLDGQFVVSTSFEIGVTIANLAIALRDEINNASIPFTATSTATTVTITADSKRAVVLTTMQQIASNYIGNIPPIFTNTIVGIDDGITPCGEAFLIWKSRFGGWMWWGFDMKKKDLNHSYGGRLQVGMFESTADFNGDPFIPVDYTEISTSYTMTLKALALNSTEMLAVSGIKASAAIYYLEPGSQNLELMRLQSADTPWSVLAHGGDFSVSLRSISTTKQTTI